LYSYQANKGIICQAILGNYIAPKRLTQSPKPLGTASNDVILVPKTWGRCPKDAILCPKAWGVFPKRATLCPEVWGIYPEVLGVFPKEDSSI